MDTALWTASPRVNNSRAAAEEVTGLDDIVYHEMSADYSDTNPYADGERQEKIRRLEQLAIRPAITVYKEPD